MGIKMINTFLNQNSLSVRINPSFYNDFWKITAIWKKTLPKTFYSEALHISLLNEEVKVAAQSFLIKLCDVHPAKEISVAFLKQSK